MATISKSKEMVMIGNKLVKSRVLGNNSHESTNTVSSTSSRGIHSSMYDKNPEGYSQPTLVPDDVVNDNRCDKYWVPHPETGVFAPGTKKHSESSTKIVNSEGVMEEKAWFRSTDLEDMEMPHC